MNSLLCRDDLDLKYFLRDVLVGRSFVLKLRTLGETRTAEKSFHPIRRRRGDKHIRP